MSVGNVLKLRSFVLSYCVELNQCKHHKISLILCGGVTIYVDMNVIDTDTDTDNMFYRLLWCLRCKIYA